MSTAPLLNRVREQRQRRGWSQAELAERTGVSRTAISAIEGQRLVPSVAAALAIAQAFATSVEELFGAERAEPANSGPTWAWSPPREPWRYWQAEVGGRVHRFPVEPTVAGYPSHDGVGSPTEGPSTIFKRASETIVVASCDPAAGLLAQEYERQTGLRMLVFTRSSRDALELLRQGLVHVAGLHFASEEQSDFHERLAHERLAQDFCLLRAATWQSGIAVAPGRTAKRATQIVRSNPRWIGRPVGSAARDLQDDLLPKSLVVRHEAPDHRSVAAAIRGGWGDAGICLQLPSEEAGLNFVSVRQETYDLCFLESAVADRRLQSLVLLLQSSAFRQLIGELPGYDARSTGELRTHPRSQPPARP